MQKVVEVVPHRNAFCNLQIVFAPYLETMNLYAEIVIASAGKAQAADVMPPIPARFLRID
jgi:hypothetical protein